MVCVFGVFMEQCPVHVGQRRATFLGRDAEVFGAHRGLPRKKGEGLREKGCRARVDCWMGSMHCASQGFLRRPFLKRKLGLVEKHCGELAKVSPRRVKNSKLRRFRGVEDPAYNKRGKIQG